MGTPGREICFRRDDHCPAGFSPDRSAARGLAARRAPQRLIALSTYPTQRPETTAEAAGSGLKLSRRPVEGFVAHGFDTFDFFLMPVLSTATLGLPGEAAHRENRGAKISAKPSHGPSAKRRNQSP